MVEWGMRSDQQGDRSGARFVRYLMKRLPTFACRLLFFIRPGPITQLWNKCRYPVHVATHTACYDNLPRGTAQVLDIRERVLGVNHPEVAACANNLAVLLRALERHGEAEALYVRSIAIKERAMGPTHPQAWTLSIAACTVIFANTMLASNVMRQTALCRQQPGSMENQELQGPTAIRGAPR